MQPSKKEIDALLAALRSAKKGSPELDIWIARVTGAVSYKAEIMDEHTIGPQSKCITNSCQDNEKWEFYPRYTQSLDATENKLYDGSWWWESMALERIENGSGAIQEYRYKWTAHGLSEDGNTELTASESHHDNLLARALVVLLSHIMGGEIGV